MAAENPRLRPYGLGLAEDGGKFFLFDQFRISWPPLELAPPELAAVRYFTGQASFDVIRTRLHGELPGSQGLFTDAFFESLVTRLEQSLFLDSETFADYLAGPLRRSSTLAGMTPDDLTADIAKLFDGVPPAPKRNVRGVLVPHMDYGRGGTVYGHGFRAVERCDADLFFIVATSHYSPARFTLTRMDYQTSLGRVTTDQASIDRIVQHYGDGLFDDPVAHLPEHSIELEVAILQSLRPNRPFRIVPLLVGSFADCVKDGVDPRSMPDIARMIEALKKAEADAGENVCYVISGDLAHIGKKFDDPDLLDDTTLQASRRQDDNLVAALNGANLDEYYRVIAGEGDRRRICGLPPTVVAIEAMGAKYGEVLAYSQYVHPQRTESVSFASAVFC